MTQKSVAALTDDLRQGADASCDHRGAARHRLGDAEAERLVEADEMQERVGSSEHLGAPSGFDRADVLHAVVNDVEDDAWLG